MKNIPPLHVSAGKITVDAKQISLARVVFTRAIIVALFALSSSLHAQSTWNGSASAGWGTGPNWTPTGVPVNTFTNDLVFTNPPTNYNTFVGNTDRVARSLTFASTLNGDFSISFNQNNATASNSATSRTLILQAASGNATVTVESGASGNITLGYVIGSDVGSLILGSNLDVVHNGTGTLLINRPVTGTNGMTKSGSGTMVLSGTNTYGGATTVSGGVLRLDNNGALGAVTNGTTVTSGATLDLNSRNIGGEVVTITGTGVGGNGAIVNNGATQAANVRLALAGSASIGGTGRVNTAFNNTIIDGGTNALTKIGAGEFGINIGTVNIGRINVDQGSVSVVNNAGGLGDTNYGTFVASGASLIFFNNNAAIGSTNSENITLAGGASLFSTQSTNANTLNGTITLSDGNANVSVASTGLGMVLGGEVTGAGGLTKSDSGRLVLSGNNTYAGATAVSAGELRIEGNQGSATGDLTVAAGATLSGSGTIGGATTVSGIHNPGSSPGVQSFSSGLTYDIGSAINWELTDNTTSGRGTIFDGIDLLGASNLSFAGSTTMNLVFNQASSVSWANAFWNANQDWLVYDLDAGTPQNFENLSINAQDWSDSLGDLFSAARPGASFSLTQTGEDIYLSYAVPEPSTWALLALGTGALALRLRRRGRKSLK